MKRQIVIEIDDIDFEAIKHGKPISAKVMDALIHGKPLPKGEWIEKSYNFECCSAECSICGKRSRGNSHDTGWGWKYSFDNFCPKCGAKMVEPQKSEDKE